MHAHAYFLCVHICLAAADAEEAGVEGARQVVGVLEEERGLRRTPLVEDEVALVRRFRVLKVPYGCWCCWWRWGGVFQRRKYQNGA